MERDTRKQQTPAECTFCRIVRGELPAHIVAEDAWTMAFLDHRPLVPGHCLVIPKAHHVTIADLPAAVITPLFASVQRVARAVEAGMEADGTFVAINNRVSQSVSHLHVHIVPRRFKDGLFTANFVWKRRPYPDEAAAEATRRAIQEALERRTTANESAPISR